MYNGYIFGMSLLVGCAAGRSGDRRAAVQYGIRVSHCSDAVEILAQRYDFSGNTTNAYRLGTYNYTIDYAKSKFAAVWEKAYSLIANCNKLLEYAEKNEEVLTGKNAENDYR